MQINEKNGQILNFCRKNGGIIRPTGIFFQNIFGLIHLAGLRVLKHFFEKNHLFLLFSSLHFLFHSPFHLLFHPVFLLHLVLLLLSSCPLSSLLSIFSSLVFNLLFHLHLSLLSSFIFLFLLFHCLVFSFLVLSCLVSLSLSLSLFLSVSVSLCLRVVWCVWCVLCFVLCCVVCGVVCGAAWHAETTSLCRFTTSTTRTCVTRCGRGAGTHGDVFELTSRPFALGSTQKELTSITWERDVSLPSCMVGSIGNFLIAARLRVVEHVLRLVLSSIRVLMRSFGGDRGHMYPFSYKTSPVFGLTTSGIQ